MKLLNGVLERDALIGKKKPKQKAFVMGKGMGKSVGEESQLMNDNDMTGAQDSASRLINVSVRKG